MKRWCRRLAVVVGIASNGPLLALDPERAVSQYVVTRWNAEQGLPDHAVRTLVQTHDGYLWLGTFAGIARFDGVRFVVFDSRNSGLQDDVVEALVEDRHHSLWIGTLSGGLHRMRGQSIEPEPRIASRTIQALAADPKDGVWVASSNGLYHLPNSGPVRRWGRAEGLLDEQVFAVLPEDGERVYLATRGGVQILRGGALYAAVPLPAGEFVRAFHRRSDGSLWLGGARALYRVEDDRVVAHHPTPKANLHAYDLLDDREGQLWVTGYGAGLMRLNGSRFEAVDADRGFFDRRPWQLIEDREGSLWVATRTGLLRLRDGPVVSWAESEGLANRHVRGVHLDPDGTVWIAHLSGITALRAGVPRNYDQRDGLPLGAHSAILRDEHGTLWVGGEQGLSRFDGARFHPLAFSAPAERFSAKVLLRGTRGRIWVGTDAGLAQIRRDRLHRLEAFEPIRGLRVESLFEDRSGALWIGTLDGGLWRYREERMEPIELEPEAVLGVRSIHEDAEGRLWVGSLSSGLFLIHRGRVHRVRGADGFPAIGVWSIVEDRTGGVWFSSDRGLFRFRRDDLLAHERGDLRTVSPEVWLTERDGMKSRECNGGGSPAGVLASDGTLWFATAGGAVMVDPERLQPAPGALPTYIEDVRVTGRGTTPMVDAHVSTAERALELTYTALYLAQPDAIRFRYRLHGQDPDWVYAGSRRTAYYTNLAPHNYRFEVQANLYPSDVWGPSRRLTVTVQPHWYERWTYRTALALSGIGLVLLWLRARARVHQTQEARLRDEVALRTTELRVANDELARIAAIDALTGAATPRAFWQRLETELARVDLHHPLALVLCDVDHFKAYNDTFGHVQGDACLRHVAEALRIAFGPNALVARYGGEEFAVLMPGTDGQTACSSAESARRRVEDLALPAGLGAAHPVVTLSAGITVIRDRQLPPRVCAEQADRALYRAKSAGRNRIEAAERSTLT